VTSKESATTTTMSGSLAMEADAGNANAVPPSAAGSAPRSLSGKKVLHVGDSMVGGTWGLTRAFEAKLLAEGARIVRHTKVSESLTSFDKSPTLKDLLRTHEPDIVVITLGANDALVPHPEVFAHSIQSIVRRVGDRECWWMGPPMPKDDAKTSPQRPRASDASGIVAVLKDNVAPCRFFDATTLDLERASDGIHPSDRGGAKWADAFWEAFESPSPASR
jgi:lysophospholipase L1-like esterase